MKKLPIAYFLVLPALLVGCVRATFSPVVPEAGTTNPPDDVGVCPDPSPTCSPTALPCDPYCQAGNGCNWCSDKCTVSYDGTPSCAKVAPIPNGLGDGCNISDLGSSAQTDTCDRGLICMGDYASALFNTHCFQLCQGPSDCKGVSCSKRPVGPPAAPGASPPTALVCDPSYKTCLGTQAPYSYCCDPLTGGGCDVGETCYLVSQPEASGNSRTVCEYWSGSGRASDLCFSSTDCGIGLFCSSGRCIRACDLNAADPLQCPVGLPCTPRGNQFGYCGN
jgi:hypothetical protein